MATEHTSLIEEVKAANSIKALKAVLLPLLEEFALQGGAQSVEGMEEFEERFSSLEGQVASLEEQSGQIESDFNSLRAKTIEDLNEAREASEHAEAENNEIFEELREQYRRVSGWDGRIQEVKDDLSEAKVQFGTMIGEMTNVIKLTPDIYKDLATLLSQIFVDPAASEYGLNLTKRAYTLLVVAANPGYDPEIVSQTMDQQRANHLSLVESFNQQ